MKKVLKTKITASQISTSVCLSVWWKYTLGSKSLSTVWVASQLSAVMGVVDAGNQLKGKLDYVAASGYPAVTLFRFRVMLSRSPEASSGFESLWAESSICRTDSRGRPRRTCGRTLVFIWNWIANYSPCSCLFEVGLASVWLDYPWIWGPIPPESDLCFSSSLLCLESLPCCWTQGILGLGRVLAMIWTCQEPRAAETERSAHAENLTQINQQVPKTLKRFTQHMGKVETDK